MYQRVIFETAEEYFEACDPNSEIRPNVPTTVYVVFDGETDPRLSGDDHQKFGLENVSQADMIEAAFHIAGSRIHLT